MGMIIGCIGFVLNVISATILHEHDHDAQEAAGVPQSAHLELPESYGTTGEQRGPLHDNHRHETLDRSRRGKDGDLGIMGVLIHVGGDAANNIGVIIAGAVIWKTKSPRRYYADPAVSVAIALMIFFSSIPLVKKSGLILLESAPSGVTLQPELAPRMIAILNEGADPGGGSADLRERRSGDSTCVLRCGADGCVSPSCCD